MSQEKVVRQKIDKISAEVKEDNPYRYGGFVVVGVIRCCTDMWCLLFLLCMCGNVSVY